MTQQPTRKKQGKKARKSPAVTLTLSPEVLKVMRDAVKYGGRRPKVTASSWVDRVLREALHLPTRGLAAHAASMEVMAAVVTSTPPALPDPPETFFPEGVSAEQEGVRQETLAHAGRFLRKDSEDLLPKRTVELDAADRAPEMLDQRPRRGGARRG